MRRTFWLGGLVMLLLFTSCGSSKRLTYLQDMEYLKMYPEEEQVENRIKKYDKLDIVVTCKNPELALPFNISGGTMKVNSNGEVLSESVSTDEKKGYIVSKKGTIDFPILGELMVEGLTLDELKTMIEEKIIEKNYIRDPMVLADFMNFQITILGEVNNNGNFPIKNNRVNLIEAIAMAGDLTKNAKREEVLVIRTINGKRVVYPHNMRSKEIYDSPAFYLQQNDVIYVKPNKHQTDGNFERKTTLISLVLTFITAFASVYHWVIK